jgi:hypothetical protein
MVQEQELLLKLQLLHCLASMGSKKQTKNISINIGAKQRFGSL